MRLLALSLVVPALVILLAYVISRSADLYLYMPTYLRAVTRIATLSSSLSSLPAATLHHRLAATAAANMSTSKSSLSSSIHNTILAAFAADSLSLGGPRTHPHTLRPTASETYAYLLSVWGTEC